MATTSKEIEDGPGKMNRSFLLTVVFFFVLSRLLIILTPVGLLVDMNEFIQYGEVFLNSTDPYAQFGMDPQGFLVAKYPPLYLLQSAMIQFIFGSNSAGMRLGFLFYDFGITTVLFFFSRSLRGKSGTLDESEIALKSVILYSISPITLIIFLGLPQKLLAQLMMMLGLFAFYKQRDYLTGVFFCLGFLTEIYPIFCLIPIWTFLIARKEWKKLVRISGSVILVFTITSIPFILLDATTFWFGFLTHFSRIPQALSLWTAIPGVEEFSLDIFGILQVGTVGLVFVCFIAIYTLLCLKYFIRNKTASETAVIPLIAVFFFCLPLVYLTFNFRYFFWLLPVCFLMTNPKISKRGLMAILAQSTTILGIYMIYMTVNFPGYAFVDILTLPYERILEVYESTKIAYLVLVICFSVGWVPFIRDISIPGKRTGNISLMHYINLLLVLFWIQVIILTVFSTGEQGYPLASYVFIGGSIVVIYLNFFLIKEFLPWLAPEEKAGYIML